MCQAERHRVRRPSAHVHRVQLTQALDHHRLRLDFDLRVQSTLAVVVGTEGQQQTALRNNQ
jgi:hypothetical protein